ncbi:ATP-grasp ribosomal peptide maturase [Streptomyces griseoviridis]|uniref:ATP-grasp ribosomal peptide maturase n=1 Tax=Streptomyces griseoviridis TaxID=45398 RepID=A0A3Q9KX85_STRGD|nr:MULTISPECIES: ATP-grasp ribosomal peptide maturase [Streptomyces]AZS86509.1 ATP-grasp ribosomal peptide maturase [Streptomyces griseoviridis]MDH6700053.1 ATP-grasp ribosomal peptide maturase [Streptomyces sp. MAA16]QCN86626.1 ATP-grasp ribosomal peptide maturase [Streptomyces griseoviridis]
MCENSAVLVATEADDPTADMVITELNRRGTPVVRFDPADIGMDLTLSARFGGCAAPVTGELRTPSRAVDLTEVRSVYWRRPVWPAFDGLGEDDARFAAAQVRYGLGGTLHALSGPLWVNHPLRNAEADYKPAQLAVARRLGLAVPPTLVTNDPAEARCFAAAHDQVIYKTLRWTPYRRDGVPVTGWADPVTAAEIDERVRVVPHLFQAVVDKVADLRVLVVGRQVFAVRIESGILDWRRDYSALSYRAVELPGPVERALLAHLDHFGLVSGSFDLAVDREGCPWWLELNPNGQWGWLQEPTGLPMSAAFAELLTQGALS